jgi:hypothetical protein
MFGIHEAEDAAVAPEESVSGATGLDLSSAMVRAEADQLEARLRALLTRLSAVPGLELSVSYRHGRVRRLLGDLPYVNDLNRRTGPIERVVIVVGPCSYWLSSELGAIRCGRQAIPALSEQADQELTFSVWAKTLFDEIARRNIVNHDSLVALRQLVEHDQVR